MNKYINSKKSDLDIAIKNSSKEYKSKQPINIAVSIKNLTNKKILANHRCTIGVELVFDIKKPSGVKSNLKQLIYLDSPSLDDLIGLDEKKTFKFSVDLRNYYNFDETGVYRVKAIYKPFNGNVKEAWDGRIVSNTIQFKIV
jgi:hypothetical protein